MAHTAMLDAHPGGLDNMDKDRLAECIAACYECAQVCTACADACLAEDYPNGDWADDARFSLLPSDWEAWNARPTHHPVLLQHRAERTTNDQHPQPHYGVSTGFGALATRHIAPELRTQLQRSLVRSHAAGSGPEVEREVVRALMLLRLSTLATGHTGVRRETAENREHHVLGDELGDQRVPPRTGLRLKRLVGVEPRLCLGLERRVGSV